MSFILLKVQPTYDYISETYSWTFFNLLTLKQNFLLDGSVKYSFNIGYNKSENLFITKSKHPTIEEHIELSKLVSKKIWYYLDTESKRTNEELNIFNSYIIALENKQWLEEYNDI